MLDWLRALTKEERVEYRWPIGMPWSRPLGGGLNEVRSNLPSGRTARLIFFATRSRLIIVGGFIKKSRRTPWAEIELARARKKAWELASGRSDPEEADDE